MFKSKAIEEYNAIMSAIGLEHNTIGTRESKGTENWNLRDMVAECNYMYNLYMDSSTVYGQMYDNDYNTWKGDSDMLYVFVGKYKGKISGIKASKIHYSIYDTERRY